MDLIEEHHAQTARLVLAVADALDALDRVTAAGSAAPPETQPLLNTVGLIGQQLESALDAAGGCRTGIVGETAEPSTHRVTGVRPGTSDDQVVEVVQRGYVYQGRVLRPAQVIVETTVSESGPQ